MVPTKMELQLNHALWALRRIIRKQGGLKHSRGPETCDCPQCIARDAIAQIEDYDKQEFVKTLVK